MGAQRVCSHCPAFPYFAVTHRQGAFYPVATGQVKWKLEVYFLPVLSFCLCGGVPSFFQCSFAAGNGAEAWKGVGREATHCLGTKLSSCCAVGHASALCVLWGSRARAHMFPRTPLQVCVGMENVRGQTGKCPL